MTKNSTTARKPRTPKTKLAVVTPVLEPAPAEAAPAAEPVQEHAAAVPTQEPAQAAPAAEPAKAPGPAANALPAALIVRGPKKGFRRGGIAFGGDPIELLADDWDKTPAGAERLLAILSEPALKCVLRLEDGTEEPIMPELLEQLRAAAAEAADA